MYIGLCDEEDAFLGNYLYNRSIKILDIVCFSGWMGCLDLLNIEPDLFKIIRLKIKETNMTI